MLDDLLVKACLSFCEEVNMLHLLDHRISLIVRSHSHQGLQVRSCHAKITLHASGQQFLMIHDTLSIGPGFNAILLYKIVKTCLSTIELKLLLILCILIFRLELLSMF